MKLLIALLLLISPLESCSRVFWNDAHTKVVIRSMDLNRTDNAKVILSPRGYERRSDMENGLCWQAKYGSVITTSFDQGTTDGMNEKGLAAHLHYLEGTEYLSRRNLPKIGINLWIQYFLDTCVSVQEVVRAAETFQVVDLQIGGQFWPLFAIVEDASGQTAILEYIEGQLHIHQGSAFNVATNDPFYEIHLQNVQQYAPFGSLTALPEEQDSLSRFVRASAYLESLPSNAHPKWETVAKIIQIIEKPHADWQTLWLTISDLQNLHYYFLRSSDKKVLFIDLNKIDFEGHSLPLMLFSNIPDEKCYLH